MQPEDDRNLLWYTDETHSPNRLNVPQRSSLQDPLQLIAPLMADKCCL